MLGITTSVIFCYSDGVTDVVKSNGKTLSASTANSVGMKDVKNKNSDDTIYRKTTDCISREKLNVRFMAYFYCILVISQLLVSC